MTEQILTLLIAVPLVLILTAVLALVMVHTRSMAEMEIQALDRSEAQLGAELDVQPLTIAGHQRYDDEMFDRGTRRLLADVFPEEGE